MLLMLVTFEFLFMLVDFIIFLLEPIVLGLFNCLNFRRPPTYSKRWPWLLDGQKVSNSLRGLGKEMQDYYEKRRKLASECQSVRSKLVRVASDAFGWQWPWLGFHEAPREPTEQELEDWIGHDLGLVADWDACVPLPLSQSHFQELAKLDELELLASSERSLVVQLGPDERNRICCRMMTYQEASEQRYRSALVFYFLQKYPESGRAHAVLASLFEQAGLMEPTLAKRLGNAELAAGSQSKAGRLSSYALFLMLVARLEQSSGSNASSSSSQLLVDFLAHYSQCRGTLIKPVTLKNRKNGPPVLMLQEEAISEEKLVVVDPVKLFFCLDKPEKAPSRVQTLVDGLHFHLQHQFLDTSQLEEASLTSHFKLAKELVNLCASLSEKLTNQLATGSPNSEQTETVLGVLIEDEVKLRSRFAPSERRGPIQAIKATYSQLAPYLPDLRLPTISGKRKLSDASVERLAKVKIARRKPLNLPWCRILTHFLYIAIFLLIRDEILKGVLKWRTILNEKAREDWIQMKHLMFPQGFQGWDEGHLSDFFVRERPMGGVDAWQLSEEDSLSKDANISIEEVPSDGGAVDEIWEPEKNLTAAAADGNLTVANETDDSSKPDSGRIDAKELLGELMKAMMSEAMGEGGGDMDLASLLGDLGLDEADFRPQPGDKEEEEEDENAETKGEDGEEKDKAKWRRELGKLDLFGMRNMIAGLADRLKRGDVPRPEEELRGEEETPVAREDAPDSPKDEL